MLNYLPEVFPVENISSVKELFKKLSYLHLCEPKNYEEKKAITEKLLLLLSSEAININTQNKPPKDKANSVKNAILKNFGTEFSTSKLAGELGFFRRSFNKSI